MRYVRSRKYPITHLKKTAEPEVERYFDLSVAAAAGVLAFVLVKGVFLGYMIRKWTCRY